MIDVRIALAEKMAISIITMWPALIFAARRKDKVIGRTEILEDSMRTRNGFSQEGAPPGSRAAINLIGEERREEMIRLSQRVRPNEKVKTRWLDELKVYGINPVKLIKIKRRKSGATILFHPGNCRDRERESWLKMVFSGARITHVRCVG